MIGCEVKKVLGNWKSDNNKNDKKNIHSHWRPVHVSNNARIPSLTTDVHRLRTWWGCSSLLPGRTSAVASLRHLLADFLKYFPCLTVAVRWNWQGAESLSSSLPGSSVDCSLTSLLLTLSLWQGPRSLSSEISIGTTRSTSSSRLSLRRCFDPPDWQLRRSRLFTSLRRNPRLAFPGIESFVERLLAGRVLLMRESATGMVKAGSVLVMRLLGTEAVMLGNGLGRSAACNLSSPVTVLLHKTQHSSVLHKRRQNVT